MADKTPHLHAEFLAEAIQDIHRKIKAKHIYGDFWEEVTLSFVAGATPEWEFCFTDMLESQIMSSLTDEELFSITDKHNPSGEDINYCIIRAIANAAAQRQVEDMAEFKSPSKGELSQNVIDQERITPEERMAQYKKSKFRIY